MNDPWHQETLERLVAAIEAARVEGGTAWAVVIASSERLGGEVVGELLVRLGHAEPLRVCTYVDPRHAIQQRLAEPLLDGFRTTIIQGLPTVFESKRGEGLLGWLNFRRESFSRPGEAFVFVLTREAADRWVKEAPDLDRYTAHFGFQDWDDLVEAAERAAAKTELEGDDGATRLKHARERVKQARRLGGDFVVGALSDVGALELHAGLFPDAERTLAEAWSLAAEASPGMRARVVLERAYLLLEQGHPDSALQVLRSADGASIDELSMATALCAVHDELGKDASSYRKRYPDLERRLAETQHPAELLDAGDLYGFLSEMSRLARIAAHKLPNAVFVSLMVLLARATLDVGRPRRSMELLDDARMLPGSQSATLRHFVVFRAEARWILDGPIAVASIVYEEEQRQRGWSAPIPAAELSYARGLACTNDDDARRYLQDAADRSRVMEGATSFLEEPQLELARLDRRHGELDRAAARLPQPHGPRKHTELAMIALGRRDAKTAHEQALRALDLLRARGSRLYEPAALVALAAAERGLGNLDSAASHDARWRRLVRGIEAKGLAAALERDAAWAAEATR